MMEEYAFQFAEAERRAAIVRHAELMRLVNEGRPRIGRRQRLAALLRDLAAWVDERQPSVEAGPSWRPQSAGGAC